MQRPASKVIRVAVLAMWLLALPGAETLSAQPSSALFQQMFAVFEHPRCMNCHTGEAFPRQGDDRHRHTMNVMRGPADTGAAGLHCSTCHQAMNQAASGVPGASDWHLAPARMAWIGLSPGQLCRALRDPAKGGMSPDQMLPHFATGLIRWGWEPGTNAHGRARATPPISYAEFIGLTKRWIESGATCPE
jgi:mono/diheme cytochrome c family protein